MSGRRPYQIERQHSYRLCKICKHPQRAGIERALLDGDGYRTISKNFDVDIRVVSKHQSEHLLPFMEDVQKETRKYVVRQLTDLAEEIYLPLMEKIKYGQHLSLTTYRKAMENSVGSKSVHALAPAIKALSEFRGWVREEAKVTGEYQRERKNQYDLRTERLRKAITQRARAQGITYLDELRFYLNSEFSEDIIPDIRRELLADLAEEEHKFRLELASGNIMEGERLDARRKDGKEKKNGDENNKMEVADGEQEIVI